MSTTPKLVIIKGEKPQYWWTYQEGEPYLSGVFEEDYFGPHASEGAALHQIYSLGASPDVPQFERIEFDAADESFWETVTADYEVGFMLPLDELTEHFSPLLDDDRDDYSPLAASLTGDVQVLIDGPPTNFRVKHIRKKGSLECYRLDAHPQGTEEPFAAMALSITVELQKPRIRDLASLWNWETSVRVAIPPYYPEPIEANIWSNASS